MTIRAVHEPQSKQGRRLESLYKLCNMYIISHFCLVTRRLFHFRRFMDNLPSRCSIGETTMYILIHLFTGRHHTKMGKEGDEEEDYGALIYRESQLRKAEAVAVAAGKRTKKKKKDSSADVSSTHRRASSSNRSSSAAAAAAAAAADSSRSSVNDAQMKESSKRKRNLPLPDGVEEQAPTKVARKKRNRKICCADG